MNVRKSLGIAALAFVLSVPAKGQTSTDFQSQYMGMGIYGGFINDPSVWSLGAAPDVNDALHFYGSWNSSTYSYNPETLYLSDVYGIGGGNYSVGSMWFQSGGSISITGYGSGDYAGLVVGSPSTEASNPWVWNQSSDVNLSVGVTVLGHSSINAALNVGFGGSFVSDSADVGDGSWSLPDASLNLADGGSATINGALTVNEFCYSPVGVSLFSGASQLPTNLNANAFNEWFYTGTGLSSQGIGAVAKLGSSTLWDFSGTAFDAENGGQINILGSAQFYSSVTGTLFNADSGGQITAGDLHMNGQTLFGQIATVTGPGSLVQIGNLYDFSAQILGSAPVYQVSDQGQLIVGDVYGISIGSEPLFDVSGGGSATAGSIDLYGSSAATLINLNGGTLNADSFAADTTAPTSIEVANGSTLAVTNQLSIFSNSAITFDVIGASTVSAGYLQLNSAGSVTLDFSDDSTIDINQFYISVGAPSTMEITPTSTWLNGPPTQNYLQYGGPSGAQDANFVIDPGVQLHRADVSLWNATAQIGSSSGAQTLLDGFELWVQDNSNVVIDNVLWQPHYEPWGFYDPTLNVTGDTPTQAGVYNTQTYELDLQVATEPSSLGTLTLGSGANIDSSEVEVGTAPWYTYPGGNGTLNLQDGAVLMTQGYVAIGALKSLDGNGVPETHSVGGTGTVNLTDASILVDGVEPSQWGGWESQDQLISLTLGAGSSLNLDPTSSVYVGNPGYLSDLILKPGVVALGPYGWLNGDGTINGINISSAQGVVVENDGGVVEPGLSPGTLTIAGTYIQNLGELVIDIAGPGAGQYGVLSATNGFDFKGGEIVVTFIDGYTGAGLSGQTLSFLNGGPIDWTGFDFLTGFVNETGANLTLNSNGTFSSNATPEPAGLAAVAFGLMALCRTRRRNRC